MPESGRKEAEAYCPFFSFFIFILSKCRHFHPFSNSKNEYLVTFRENKGDFRSFLEGLSQINRMFFYLVHIFQGKHTVVLVLPCGQISEIIRMIFLIVGKREIKGIFKRKDRRKKVNFHSRRSKKTTRKVIAKYHLQS